MSDGVPAAPRSAPLERLARLAGRLLDVPVSIVSVVDSEHHQLRASTGLPDTMRESGEVPLSHSVCRHVVADDRPLLIPETRTSDLIEARRASTDLDLQSYAGVPVRGSDGRVFGTVCVGDTSRRDWSASDADILAELASVAALEMELREDLRSAQEIDTLTGLPNRSRCEGLVREAQTVAHARGSAVAVLVVDLVRLSLVNDSLGRDIGDALLVLVARRLTDALHGVVVSRIGGDQFAVIADARDERDALLLADQVRATLREPFEVVGELIHARHSIGIALGEHDDAPEELLQGACSALGAAKQAPNDVATSRGGPLRERAAARLRLEVALRRAIDRDEIGVHYQPIFALAGERLSGFEALARWTDDELGTVSPGDFIPVAEESGLIALVGRNVLARACADAARWAPADGSPAPGISVNVSPEQLAPALPREVEAVLERTGLAPQRLTLELTESAFVSVTGETAAVLADLCRLGVRLALDDFGTGYSSLHQLAGLPLDVLKIDQSFVAKLDDPRTRTIVTATLAMAEGLGLAVTAEGIETEVQRSALHAMGCSHGQGFGLGRPAPVESAMALVAQGARAAA